MVKNQMWTIIGVSLVVALVVSLVTASITGNFIKVKKADYGTAVYTKYEVDKLLLGLNDTITKIYTGIDGVSAGATGNGSCVYVGGTSYVPSPGSSNGVIAETITIKKACSSVNPVFVPTMLFIDDIREVYEGPDCKYENSLGLDYGGSKVAFLAYTLDSNDKSEMDNIINTYFLSDMPYKRNPDCKNVGTKRSIRDLSIYEGVLCCKA